MDLELGPSMVTCGIMTSVELDTKEETEAKLQAPKKLQAFTKMV